MLSILRTSNIQRFTPSAIEYRALYYAEIMQRRWLIETEQLWVKENKESRISAYQLPDLSRGVAHGT